MENEKEEKYILQSNILTLQSGKFWCKSTGCRSACVKHKKKSISHWIKSTTRL